MIPESIAFQRAVDAGAFDGMRRHVSFSLPMPPSINRLYRAVQGRSILSKEYRVWKSDAALTLMVQRCKPVHGPVSVLVECKPADKRRRDIDNVGFKAVLDLLVTQKLIDADDSSTVREITARWVDSGPPCRVTITPVE